MNDIDLEKCSKIAKKVSSVIEKCFFDGLPCGAEKGCNCMIPLYVGKGHNNIVGFLSCPRKR